MVTLTKAEEKIMKILWEIGEGFTKDIREHYPDPKPPYNSVSTIVRVLVKKKIVGYKEFGPSHQYFPLIKKDDYRKGKLGSFIKDYYNNSFMQVVNFFSENKELDEKEIDEAIKMLEDLKQNKKNG